jgi:glycosyltransferase involved in cell wall biosynthesis
MKNKIIAIGPTTQNNTVLNGSSMMFQMYVDEMKRRNIPIIVLDLCQSLFKKGTERISGKISIYKVVDYTFLVSKLFFILLLNPRQKVYLNTGQSKIGFLRDFIIINISKLFGCKITAHQFGANYSGFYNSQPDFIKSKIIKTLGKTEKIIVEGDYSKRQFDFLPDYQTKVYSLPNGLPEKIDSSKIVAKKIDFGLPINLFYLSNLIESKGYWDVLEAINILVNEYKVNLKVVFSGKFLDSVDDVKFKNSEEARKVFFEYIEKNNLKDRITYYEGLYGEKKAKEFKKAHFFILPSYYINEGQPVSILEAMAYGCVPIVTEYRLIPTMVNLENGFFVNSKSPNEIAQKIKEMLENPETYTIMSQSSIGQYTDNFTAEKYTNHLISLF